MPAIVAIGRPDAELNVNVVDKIVHDKAHMIGADR